MENRDQGLIRERKDFSTIKTSLSIPNLIDVQRRSYERFLQIESVSILYTVYYGRESIQ